jgi:hypothetical protein
MATEARIQLERMIMAKESHAQLVEKLASDCVSQSIGSIDYGLNAKAIALMSEAVKKRIVSQLEKGLRLVQICPLAGFGSSLMDFRLLFQFEVVGAEPKERPAIDLESRSFVVSVELPTKAVRTIADYTPQPAYPPSDVPFSIAFPNLNAARPVPIAQTAGVRAREAAYFQNMGIGPGSRPGVVYPSPVGDPPGPGGNPIGPGGGGFVPPWRGPIVINPGQSPIGGEGTTTYDTSETYTQDTTNATTATTTTTESQTISDNVTDDTVGDDPHNDTTNDGQFNDGQHSDDQTGDNPHPDIGMPGIFYQPWR